MSAERNYRVYLKSIHKVAGDDNIAKFKKAFADRIAATLKKSDGERQIRTKLSKALGKIEERHHGTYIDEASNKRINTVPNGIAGHHNRLVDEVYHLIVHDEDGDLQDPVLSGNEEPEDEGSDED